MESPKSEPNLSFEAMVRLSRAEKAPELDVRFGVRQALMAEVLQARDADWMDTMIRIFSVRLVKVTTSGCLALTLITSSIMFSNVGVVTVGTTANGDFADTELTEDSDPLTTFLLDGSLS
jgi:hypothetical protein